MQLNPLRLRFHQLLWFTFGFVVLLLCVRVYLTGSMERVFLIWNIFLAWIPYALSRRFVMNPERRPVWLLLIWWLFFPNALYIVTDLIHVHESELVPAWFDVVLIFASGWLGLQLAFASFHRVECWLRFHLKPVQTHAVLLWILLTSSFGVYLGRFDRYNSWDIVTNPIGLLMQVTHYVIHPLRNRETWGITALLAILYFIVYAYQWYWKEKRDHEDPVV